LTKDVFSLDCWIDDHVAMSMGRYIGDLDRHRLGMGFG
jgi:hypothetical protein